MLVLGLRNAAHVFTRAVALIIVQLRKEGSKILVYIDDVFLSAATKDLVLEQERRLYQLFRNCGWVFEARVTLRRTSSFVQVFGVRD